jgi:hypothetical protein
VPSAGNCVVRHQEEGGCGAVVPTAAAVRRSPMLLTVSVRWGGGDVAPSDVEAVAGGTKLVLDVRQIFGGAPVFLSVRCRPPFGLRLPVCLSACLSVCLSLLCLSAVCPSVNLSVRFPHLPAILPVLSVWHEGPSSMAGP